MYVQITTRCNMTCEHCAYSCTAEGEDMSLETFRNALAHDEMIAIGGGEPTLHPLFWQILGEALSTCDHVWLATNGSRTNVAIVLANMARKGVIGCALSLDCFHDPIDDEVVHAFRDGMERNSWGGPNSMAPTAKGYRQENPDGREVRDTSNSLSDTGRAAENGIANAYHCLCPELIVKPNGDVHGCGCSETFRLGNINDGDGFTVPDEWEHGECSLNQGALDLAG